MKLSKNPSRIVGLIMGDVTVNIVPELKMQARFALLDAEGSVVGQTSRGRDWSPKVQEALVALIDAMESDELANMFGEEPADGSSEATTASPKDIPTF